MESRCTCGALLPEDARFCHKCGKPQFEEDVARLTAQEATPPAAPPIAAPAAPPSGATISFKNARAVLITMVAAAGGLLASVVIALIAASLAPFVLCAAGFVAAKLYTSATDSLSTAAGARLGWMTGLWMFLVLMVALALGAIAVTSPAGWEQLKNSAAQFPQASQLLALGPHDFLIGILKQLPFSFFFLTLLPGLGGMIGAKFSARRRPS